jgi:hypothetical protein
VHRAWNYVSGILAIAIVCAQNSLSCGEDIEAVDNVDKRNCLVFLPLIHRLCALDHDDKVIFGSLVVDLGLLGISFGHDDGWVMDCI